jgi:hypothetical protein
LKEALDISIFDSRVLKREQIWEYISIGVPNIVIIILDWGCFECSVIIAGFIGVDEQAS